MGEVAAALEREEEAVGSGVVPGLEGGGGLEGVEGAVDLEGVEAAGGVGKFEFLGESMGVEVAAPGGVGPAGDAYTQLGAEVGHRPV